MRILAGVIFGVSISVSSAFAMESCSHVGPGTERLFDCFAKRNGELIQGLEEIGERLQRIEMEIGRKYALIVQGANSGVTYIPMSSQGACHSAVSNIIEQERHVGNSSTRKRQAAQRERLGLDGMRYDSEGLSFRCVGQ